ncbi:unnamed protein product [Sphagnum troendelagicum]|uniref:Uncharacterized protein n=1 Tax=Sphagnum troendelagicum TaxID=128251 RepID=A0ABP0USC0_9BRYO
MSVVYQRWEIGGGPGGGGGGGGGYNNKMGQRHEYESTPESLLSSEPPSLSSMEEIAHESSSSSSIGDELDEDSSCSSDVDTQSKGPLDQMSSLENSLPIKKPGLSKFFGGKSKSFSSLADAKSISDLAKPENPYARRRKMGYNCHLDRHRSYPPLSRSSVTGISKKSVNGSRITLAVALKLGGIDEDDKEEATSHPASSRSSLNTLFPSRSFSLTDLPVAGSPSPPLRRTIGQL